MGDADNLEISEKKHNITTYLKKFGGIIVLFLGIYVFLFGIPIVNGQEQAKPSVPLTFKVVKSDVDQKQFVFRIFLRQPYRSALRLPNEIAGIPILPDQRITSEWMNLSVTTKDERTEELIYRMAYTEEIEFVKQGGDDCTGNHNSGGHQAWHSFSVSGDDDPFLGNPNRGTVYHYTANSIPPGEAMIEFLRSARTIQITYGATYRTGLLSSVFPDWTLLDRSTQQTCRFCDQEIKGMVNGLNDALSRFENDQCPSVEYHTALSCHFSCQRQ